MTTSDRLDCMDVIQAWAVYRDQRLWPQLLETFDPEGTIAVTWFKGRFADFVEAFGWMTRVAIWAEKWNHHPEWSNVYKSVDVVLSSHDVDGLSALDAKLARKMDSLAE